MNAYFKKIKIILCGILIFATAVRAGDNNLYFELCGSWWFYSINYERMFGEHFSARIGAGYIPGIATVPVMANYFFGSKNHRIETGIGFTYTNIYFKLGYLPIQSQSLCANLYLGYRYQPTTNGLIFRIGFSPWINDPNRYREITTFVPWGGISLGYSF